MTSTDHSPQLEDDDSFIKVAYQSAKPKSPRMVRGDISPGPRFFEPLECNLIGISIRDFEMFENARLAINKPLSVIVGNSKAGKSSIIRAIQAWRAQIINQNRENALTPTKVTPSMSYKIVLTFESSGLHESLQFHLDRLLLDLLRSAIWLHIAAWPGLEYQCNDISNNLFPLRTLLDQKQLAGMKAAVSMTHDFFSFRPHSHSDDNEKAAQYVKVWLKEKLSKIDNHRYQFKVRADKSSVSWNICTEAAPQNIMQEILASFWNEVHPLHVDTREYKIHFKQAEDGDMYIRDFLGARCIFTKLIKALSKSIMVLEQDAGVQTLEDWYLSLTELNIEARASLATSLLNKEDIFAHQQFLSVTRSVAIKSVIRDEHHLVSINRVAEVFGIHFAIQNQTLVCCERVPFVQPEDSRLIPLRNASGAANQVFIIAYTLALVSSKDHPKVKTLFLDEPSSSFDKEMQEKLRCLLMNKTGVTVMVVTHSKYLLELNHASMSVFSCRRTINHSEVLKVLGDTVAGTSSLMKSILNHSFDKGGILFSTFNLICEGPSDQQALTLMRDTCPIGSKYYPVFSILDITHAQNKDGIRYAVQFCHLLRKPYLALYDEDALDQPKRKEKSPDQIMEDLIKFWKEILADKYGENKYYRSSCIFSQWACRDISASGDAGHTVAKRLIKGWLQHIRNDSPTSRDVIGWTNILRTFAIDHMNCYVWNWVDNQARKGAIEAALLFNKGEGLSTSGAEKVWKTPDGYKDWYTFCDVLLRGYNQYLQGLGEEELSTDLHIQSGCA